MSSTTRRIIFKGAARFTGRLAVAVCVPSILYAGCTSSTGSYEFNHDGIISLPDWKLGDCELKQATLHTSGAFIILNSQVCTHFTHTKDVWHMTVDVFTRDNTDPSKIIPLGTGKMDGPQMSEQDHPLFHTWNARFGFNLTASKGHRIAAKVTSCC